MHLCVYAPPHITGRQKKDPPPPTGRTQTVGWGDGSIAHMAKRAAEAKAKQAMADHHAHGETTSAGMAAMSGDDAPHFPDGSSANGEQSFFYYICAIRINRGVWDSMKCL